MTLTWPLTHDLGNRTSSFPDWCLHAWSLAKIVLDMWPSKNTQNITVQCPYSFSSRHGKFAVSSCYCHYYRSGRDVSEVRRSSVSVSGHQHSGDLRQFRCTERRQTTADCRLPYVAQRQQWYPVGFFIFSPKKMAAWALLWNRRIPGGPKSGASAYFCLYLLNALPKSNNFGTLKQQFMLNTALNNIYSDLL